jgi:hypothetical protein
MLSSSEKSIVLFGAIFGSVFIFSTSLASLNTVLIYNNSKTDESNLNKIIIVNGMAMEFSGVAFSYFTYNGTK